MELILTLMVLIIALPVILPVLIICGLVVAWKAVRRKCFGGSGEEVGKLLE